MRWKRKSKATTAKLNKNCSVGQKQQQINSRKKQLKFFTRLNLNVIFGHSRDRTLNQNICERKKKLTPNEMSQMNLRGKFSFTCNTSIVRCTDMNFRQLIEIPPRSLKSHFYSQKIWLNFGRFYDCSEWKFWRKFVSLGVCTINLHWNMNNHLLDTTKIQLNTSTLHIRRQLM